MENNARIYLFGERHGVATIMDEELRRWGEFYSKGMRHLFLEVSFITAQFLNAGDERSEGTPAGEYEISEDILTFAKRVRAEYSETIFHGTDIEFDHENAWAVFSVALHKNGLENSPQSTLAQASIEQAREYLDSRSLAFRENAMVANFIREFDALGGACVMGIYGAAHTGLHAKSFDGSVDSMANQLRQHYGERVTSEDLSAIPNRTDALSVNGIEYRADYYGKAALTGFKDFVSREFWRVQNAFDDVKNLPKTGDILPHNNYPMQVEVGQVYVLDYTKTDGNVTRQFYRCDGMEADDLLRTEEFK